MSSKLLEELLVDLGRDLHFDEYTVRGKVIDEADLRL